MVIPNDGATTKYIHFLQVYKNKTFAAKNNKKVAFALHCIRKAPHILAPAHRWQGPTQTCQTSPEQLFGTLFRQNYYASLFPAAISNSYLQIAVWQNHGTQLDSSLMIRF